MASLPTDTSPPKDTSLHFFSEFSSSESDAGSRQIRRSYLILKRVIDIFIVLVSAPITLPLVALLAILIRFDGEEPFFHQERVGRNGRLFTFWKLRTMVSGADQRLEEILAASPAARDEWNTTQKLKSDPRITRLGRILRRTSADELPQLWNVLIGDMSLVGPRPMLPEQQSIYPGSAYFALRPGLTGLWQISARNESSFVSRAYFDTKYASTMSLIVDTSILIKTIGVVIHGTGW
ncbi:sugar transferase [Nordella sp. HKS 07]|uniref:sugar transferase n=1 Tax=Nordella sp. HKS 07 TaxID=2712222 RepID=UPI001FF031B8|nr:sugar transferase [Nordella sp. HKS 07]